MNLLKFLYLKYLNSLFIIVNYLYIEHNYTKFASYLKEIKMQRKS